MVAVDFKIGSIYNCGVLYLTQLGGCSENRVMNLTAGGGYDYTDIKTALLRTLQVARWTKSSDPKELSDIHTSALAWTDVDGYKNGDALCDFFRKEGHVVLVTELGHNVRYGETPEIAKGHQLRHYIALLNKKNGPGAGKWSLVKEYKYAEDTASQPGDRIGPVSGTVPPVDSKPIVNQGQPGAAVFGGLADQRPQVVRWDYAAYQEVEQQQPRAAAIPPVRVGGKQTVSVSRGPAPGSGSFLGAGIRKLRGLAGHGTSQTRAVRPKRAFV